MDAVLTATGVHKTFGRTVALGGASFELRRGEWLGLLGPNGAGKTTLVRAVAGRVRPDSGVIALLGTDLVAAPAKDVRAARARVGIVPQEIALYPYLTARENLEVFGSLAGLSGSVLAERVAWALEFTGLRERAGDRTQTFSGGMKRRLNIACSVLHRPEVILLDEPTVGVDPQSRERIWEMLSRLRDDGASMLLTSHQLDEVERVCDRIVIIDRGKVIAEGTVADLIAQTIGSGRRVTILFESRAPEEDARLRERMEIAGDRGVCTIERVARDLPGLLDACAAAGAAVRDIEIETPTLQSVFIHLTGRELRE